MVLPARSPIVLLTDFGTQDSYVGVMKGVIASIAPTLQIIDLSHAIRPQDVAHAAYTLAISAPYFPDGTVFCCVVDPGVGSQRRAVAIRIGPWTVVTPDNGLPSRLLDQLPATDAVTLDDPRFHLDRRSATFHGRDLFAPVAAYLAAGAPFDALGSPLPVTELVRLPLPPVERTAFGWRGSVQHIDRFGNLITTLSLRTLGTATERQVVLPTASLAIPRISHTYSDVGIGEPVAYWGSDGFLELAIRQGNAAQMWAISAGATVELYPSDTPIMQESHHSLRGPTRSS